MDHDDDDDDDVYWAWDWLGEGGGALWTGFQSEHRVLFAITNFPRPAFWSCHHSLNKSRKLSECAHPSISAAGNAASPSCDSSRALSGRHMQEGADLSCGAL